MEETKNLELGSGQEQEEKSAIDFQLIYSTLILNWKWFVLSLIVCLGMGYLYLRYTRPQYQATAKLLIKDDDQNKSSGMGNSMIQNAANLGFISNSNGIDNEIEILSAQDLATQAVIDMKCYVNYYHKGTFKDQLVYKEQEVNVDLDLAHLKKLNAPIKLKIEKDGNQYLVTGSYYIPVDAFSSEKEPVKIEKTLASLPASINTRVGTATAAIANSDTYAQKLQEANTQVELLNELGKYMNEPGNRYQPIPSNVGLTDESSTELINEYNKIALNRNQMLHSASENSPTVTPLSAQLDDLTKSIKRAMRQAKLGMEIQRNSIAKQAAMYASQIGNSPEQERVLTQIGRQQEVKSGLYLMLLQKREENSISLAATADKGKVIDAPSLEGKVSPKSPIIMLIALVLGIAIPAGILFLREFFKYKIEGHEDVIKLTQIPVIADIPVASDATKKEGKADIVVHQNVNNLMEEIFRGLRTNIQFMLKEGEKVMMFTSSTSGEGKTFVASNIGISLALLGKKVIMVGLDIRKPRLAELFEIDNHHNGITNLIIHDHNTWDDIQKQILSSGVNSKLDLLMAGPVPPNPGELVTRASLDDIISQLKEHYDYVILDTAPIGLVNDSLQLGRLANLCVYVCRADYTPKASFGMINGLKAENKLPN